MTTTLLLVCFGYAPIRCVTDVLILFPKFCRATVTMQEDLSSLFSRNLSISQDVQAQLAAEQASRPETLEQAPRQEPPPVIYSITQHYHHSAHLASSSAPTTPSASTFSSAKSVTDRTSAEIILSRNGIDPGLLSSPHIIMFQQADVDEQMRLISKWKGSAGPHELTPNLGTSPSMSVETASTVSPLQSPFATHDDLRRWHDQSVQRPAAEQTSETPHLVPIHGGDSRSLDDASHAFSEPYIISGYDSLAQRDYNEQAERLLQNQRMKGNYSPLGSAVGGAPELHNYNQATDPVYQAQSGAWQRFVGQDPPPPQGTSEDMSMAFQYGAYDQLAQFGGQSSDGRLGAVGHEPFMEDAEML